MYQAGEYILYGFEGVCRVCAVGRVNLSGLNREKEYYTLQTVRHNGQIYTPTDTKMGMRRLLSDSELKVLLSQNISLPSTPAPTDVRNAADYYRSILQQLDFSKSLQLYKAFLLRQKKQSEIRKTLNATDQRFMKQTEEQLCGEMSFVMQIDMQECLRLLREKCA